METSFDSPPLHPPSIPARSPLRPPPPRSISSEVAQHPTPEIAGTDNIMPIAFQMRNRSFPSLRGLIDELPITSIKTDFRPPSPFVLSPMEDDPDSSSSSSGRPETSMATSTTPLTKRQHALHELLSSERAYASDLALVKDIYIPLALGQPVPIHISTSPSISTPPRSSSSSSRTLSTSSSSSSHSRDLPMTAEDAKYIFTNISELAVFSDVFCDNIEEALGAVLEGGVGDDRVGELFLARISDLERPYKYYITRQGSADERLQSLAKTPALEAYYARARTLASSLSHAWDLHSLLIKPVQRLLKYPLLLSTILEETPDSHPDKKNLVLAKTKIEEVARNVNEERRRAEIVNKVLTSPSSATPVGVGAAVTVKMKSLRRSNTSSSHSHGHHSHGKDKDRGGDVTAAGGEGNEEAIRVAQMHAELKRVELFAQQFARSVVEWTKSTSIVVYSLRTWAISFAKVIGLSATHGSEAFDAFLAVITDGLGPLVAELDRLVNERLLKEIAHLLMTMSKPLKLLDSMKEQEPFHYHLLNMNMGVSSGKNRPPAALLEASKNYLALRGQLANELPRYIELLHSGMSFFVRKLANIQAGFWADVRERWADLWEMLRVEGEGNAGAEETLQVWYTRWADVDDVVRELSIVNPKKIYQDKKKGTGESVVVVNHMLQSLEPTVPRVSSPQPLRRESQSSKGSSMKRTSDSSSMFGKRSSNSTSDLSKRTSNASSKISADDGGMARSRSNVHKARSPRPKTVVTDNFGQYVAVMIPPSPSSPNLPRTKSMPLPKSPSTPEDPAKERRRPSFRRKINDSSRPSSRPATPQAPSSPPFDPTDRRNSWATARAKYRCRVVHPCTPPDSVSYFAYPFFTLREGDIFEVLQEAGHPNLHPKLPLYVDDGTDCLLLCRDDAGEVGWTLASFMEPAN